MSVQFADLFEASLPVAADQGPMVSDQGSITTDERPQKTGSQIKGALVDMFHHLNGRVPFAVATPPPGLAHAEDLHQMGVGHQVVAKGIKNLVPD